MTQGDPQTAASEGHAPEMAAPEAPASAEALATQQSFLAEGRSQATIGAPGAIQAAAASAVLGDDIVAHVVPEAADVAAAEAASEGRIVVEKDEEKEEEDGEEAQDAKVDLAMGDASVMDAVSAADFSRASEPVEGDAEALAGSGSGILIGAAALAAIAAGIYIAVDDGDDDDLVDPVDPVDPVNVAPEITSDATADVEENVDVDTVVYTATATDADGDDVIYSIDADSADAGSFTIDPATGEVRFVTSPDFETQETFAITVVATDSEGNAATQDVTINVTDVVDENAAPTFTSGDEADVEENVDADTVVLTAAATDPEGDDITFSIDADGADADSFTIDPATGEVRFVTSPDFEAQETFAITLVATDSEGNATTQNVTINVTDVDNEAPAFTSDATFAVDENFGTDDVAFDVDAVDPEGSAVVFTLEGEDADQFAIDADTGEVRFVESPNFEVQETLNVTVTATDEDGNAASQDVVVTINDLDDETAVLLDDVDNDGNPNTPNPVSAADGDFTFLDDADTASFTIITGFGEGDLIEFTAGADVNFTTGADDPSDLEIQVNNGGVVSTIILDDVLEGDALVFDEDSAEEAVGFDFFFVPDAGDTGMIASENFA